MAPPTPPVPTSDAAPFGPGAVDRRFSDPAAEAPPWSTVEEVLRSSEMFTLSTVRPDGRPHTVPLPAMWLDGALHLCTGPTEQKARNLDQNAAVTLSTTDRSYREGLDVVVEGRAAPLRDHAVLERLAALWLEKLDWPFEVVDGSFAEPGFDHRATVYRVTPTKVLAFSKGEPYAQTRYLPA